MSLCYDGEKWLMITLFIVAICLTVGLIIIVGEANGHYLPRENFTNDEDYRQYLVCLHDFSRHFKYCESLWMDGTNQTNMTSENSK